MTICAAAPGKGEIPETRELLLITSDPLIGGSDANAQFCTPTSPLFCSCAAKPSGCAAVGK